MKSVVLANQFYRSFHIRWDTNDLLIFSVKNVDAFFSGKTSPQQSRTAADKYYGRSSLRMPTLVLKGNIRRHRKNIRRLKIAADIMVHIKDRNYSHIHTPQLTANQHMQKYHTSLIESSPKSSPLKTFLKQTLFHQIT